MKKPLHDRQITQWLKTGDPARDIAPLNSQERKLMLQRVWLKQSETRGLGGIIPVRWQLVAGLVGVVAMLWFFWPQHSRSSARIDLANPQVAEQPRQIHFQTPKGTRIVWVLKQPSTLSHQ